MSVYRLVWISLFCALLSIPKQGFAQTTLSPSYDLALLEENRYEEPSWLTQHGFELHGLAVLQYRQDFKHLGSFESVMLQLAGTYEINHVGVYLQPRLRMVHLGNPVQDASMWLHQGYGFYRHPWGEVKVGKIMTQFGRAWDYGFIGPLMANNDQKLIPDIGVAFEGDLSITDTVSLPYALQYSPIDGRALSMRNASPVALNRVRREHTLTARLAPVFQPKTFSVFSIAMSGQHYRASQAQQKSVWRAAADLDAHYKQISAFAEIGEQWGRDRVVLSDQSIGSHKYLWTGTEYALGPIAVHYHFNWIHYTDTPGYELMQQPGITWSPSSNYDVMVDMAFWTTSQPMPERGEMSLYVFASGSF